MDKSDSIFLPDHKGMVGAGIHKKQRFGYSILPLAMKKIK